MGARHGHPGPAGRPAPPAGAPGRRRPVRWPWRSCCPVVLDIGHVYLMSQVCIFAVIALSLTILTGWGGQVSLGQFGLVGVGAVVAARLGIERAARAAAAARRGGDRGRRRPRRAPRAAGARPLPGRQHPRLRAVHAGDGAGHAVLDHAARAPPGLHRAARSPVDPRVAHRRFFGLSLSSERTFAWFTLGVLVLSIWMVMVWRDRGVARRLVAVRDNEVAAAAAGIPIVRTKILAFALSGFMAGYAGVCLTFADQRISVEHVRAGGVDPGHLDGRDRRARLDPRRGARRALPGRVCRPSSAPRRPSSSSPAASGSWPSSSTCPAAWPSC